MTRYLLLLLSLTASRGLPAQDGPPSLRPELGPAPDLTAARFAEFAEFDSLLNVTVPLTTEGQARLAVLYEDIGELWESPCDVVGLGCSWYCGGGPDSLWATSSLGPDDPHAYGASNAHDLSYCTAWSEGVPGPGIGEGLTYRFAPDSPRLHTILVSNGLVTSEAAWRAHNRVKRLRVSENGVPVAELVLEDSMADQVFKMPRLMGQRPDGRPMDLTFTILAVYPGERTDDTVITEIWFDGIDVH